MKKCPYCDFNSHETRQEDDYTKALLRDLDNSLSYIQGRQIHTIFIGGGTPSLINLKDLEELFDGLKERLDFDNNIEITLEANPGAFEVEKFNNFRQIGINRLSIGVQSFNDNNLKLLGRIHSSNDAVLAIESAFKAGFDNVNIDLMYGLQHQSLEDFNSDINTAIAFNTQHISLYQLTIEPNTYFAKFPPKLPSEEAIWEMGENGSELLEKKGFNRYEVSAYGKTPSKHNLNYWLFGDYIGIGAGAHGKITDINSSQIFRTEKPKSPKDYMTNSQKIPKTINNLQFDFMLNALRLKDGFETSLFESRTGKSIYSISDKLENLELLGLLELNEAKIKPTNKGFNFLNEVQGNFL